MTDNTEILLNFVELTDCEPQVASIFLKYSNWNSESALDSYFRNNGSVEAFLKKQPINSITVRDRINISAVYFLDETKFDDKDFVKIYLRLVRHDTSDFITCRSNINSIFHVGLAFINPCPIHQFMQQNRCMFFQTKQKLKNHTGILKLKPILNQKSAKMLCL